MKAPRIFNRLSAALVGVAILIVVVLPWLRPTPEQRGIRPKFVMVSKGRREQFYYQNFNERVWAGPLRLRLEWFIRRVGLRQGQVGQITVFSEPDVLYVLLGYDGEFPKDSVGAVICTRSERIPLSLGMQTLKATDKHRIFWRSPPLAKIPTSGVFVITNTISGRTLFRHKF